MEYFVKHEMKIFSKKIRIADIPRNSLSSISFHVSVNLRILRNTQTNGASALVDRWKQGHEVA